MLVSGWKFIQLPFKFIPVLFIKCGGLKTVAANQDYFTPANLGFPFSKDELFTLTAISGLAGATMRIPS